MEGWRLAISWEQNNPNLEWSWWRREISAELKGQNGDFCESHWKLWCLITSHNCFSPSKRRKWPGDHMIRVIWWRSGLTEFCIQLFNIGKQRLSMSGCCTWFLSESMATRRDNKFWAYLLCGIKIHWHCRGTWKDKGHESSIFQLVSSCGF